MQLLLSGDTDKAAEEFVEVASKKIVEGKYHPYEIYHDAYYKAVDEALEHAKRHGFETDPEEVSDKVGLGPRKPQPGDTNSFNLHLYKDGKLTKRGLAFQIYGLESGRYELTVYIA